RRAFAGAAPARAAAADGRGVACAVAGLDPSTRGGVETVVRAARAAGETPMRALVIALAALLAAAPPAPAQQNRFGLTNETMPPADGYDVDALLRRSREMTESYQRDDRYPLYLEQQGRAASDKALSTTGQRELDTRRTYQSDLNRARIDSINPSRTESDRMFQRDQLQRDRTDFERA